MPTEPEEINLDESKLAIPEQCGVCGFEFLPGTEECVALMQIPLKEDGIVPAYTRPIKLTTLMERNPGWIARQRPPSKQDDSRNMFMIAHNECFNLFRTKSKLQDWEERLSTLSNWTLPWTAPSSLELHLDPVTDVQRGIALVAEIYNMPLIKSIPPEIADLIHRYSQSHAIWRFASVLDRLERLTMANVDQLDLVPLCDVAVWERGSRPTLSNTLRGEVIRLTMDWQGLAKIERLPVRPKPDSFSSKALAYVVENHKDCNEMTVNFKFGLAHLNVPPSKRDLKIWNRPCPPDLTLIDTDQNLFGTHSGNGYLPRSNDPPPNWSGREFSWAPLDNVVQVQVFERNDNRGYRPLKTCRGMLLHYSDGGQRDLGKCRHEKDTIVTYVDPSYMCLALEMVDGRGLSDRWSQRFKARFSGPEHEHDETSSTEWKCFGMHGFAEFWFTDDEVEINVVT
ncbi:hypothetical protein B0T10DRAFT_476863 [Thelonectria olida]|uniref:Uncharacterized protein n=1 Tax=Thelonectria olida TaxID=1576542 RepID=A0A9P8WH84_9HYPO|nr:hypothetical protein B0T10DRAFT_476863 [Thelonectria olida]